MKDRKISLPHILGWFTISGEPEDGKPVWYSIKFRDITYAVTSNYSPQIRGTVTMVKKRALPDWIGLPLSLTIWRFTKEYRYLSDWDYKRDLVSEALNRGIALDRQFMDEVCREADTHLADLKRRVEEEFFRRPRLVKSA